MNERFTGKGVNIYDTQTNKTTDPKILEFATSGVEIQPARTIEVKEENPPAQNIEVKLNPGARLGRKIDRMLAKGSSLGGIVRRKLGRKESNPFHKENLKDIAKMHRDQLSEASANFKAAIRRDKTSLDRANFKTHTEYLEAIKDKRKQHIGIIALRAGGLISAGVGVGLLLAPALRASGALHSIEAASAMDHSLPHLPAEGAEAHSAVNTSEHANYQEMHHAHENQPEFVHFLEEMKDKVEHFAGIDFGYDDHGKESINAFGTPGHILDQHGNISENTAETDLFNRYEKDPSVLASHMAAFGLEKPASGESQTEFLHRLTVEYINDADKHNEAMKDLANTQGEWKADIKALGSESYKSQYMIMGPDGVPMVYQDNTVDHGDNNGHVMVYTNTETGQQVMLRAECGWQVVSREDMHLPDKQTVEHEAPQIAHKHPITDEVRTTPVSHNTPIEHHTPPTRIPHTPGSPDKPDMPNNPTTPEKPPVEKPPVVDKPEVPEKPEEPKTPEQPEEPKLTPKDPTKDINANKDLNEQVKMGNDRVPNQDGKETSRPDDAPEVYKKPETSVAKEIPREEPAPRHEPTPEPRIEKIDREEPKLQKPDSGANTRIETPAPEQGAGKFDNNEGNNGRVE